MLWLTIRGAQRIVAAKLFGVAMTATTSTNVPPHLAKMEASATSLLQLILSTIIHDGQGTNFCAVRQCLVRHEAQKLVNWVINYLIVFCCRLVFSSIDDTGAHTIADWLPNTAVKYV